MNETLGERINFIRTKLGIRISELAEMIKIPVFDKSGNIIDYKTYTKTSLSLIENNKQRPSIDVVTAISDILGVSIDWLAKGVEYEGEKMLSLSQERLRFHLEITGERELGGIEKLVKEMRDSLMMYDDKIKEIEKHLSKQTNTDKKEEDS
ncbi:helix-turn-helix domain-containing protein [Paenibacillus polymyxa]|uniref:helix-turn-helix domain-containing protein n=1 Tax=Paenibacillus polymyxa TaxID=1406 RepID=UPI0025B63538|nr:helix-turn-helix transcriptional regulator [Paenibacillus polymyxa]MDN4086014.1 helix-turn-helix transcriptional regulator [Paenibacillus polymyxa]MDN4108335.1 helix-turn-helix transcriptional regulator [Paenibacillus polymyxa]